MFSEQYVEITLSDWKDILKVTPQIAENFVFRGQAFDGWALETKQHRFFEINDAIEQEAILLRDFHKIYPSSLTNTTSTAFLEFVLNRHYLGENLRFLDFTHSFLIALYYANNEWDYNFSAVYALNKTYIYNDSLATLNLREKKYQFSELELSSVNTEFFHRVIVGNKINQGLMGFNPLRTNLNAFKQQTIHVIPKKINISFINNLPSLNKKVLESNKIDDFLKQYSIIKFIIPSKMRSDIYNYLHMINISGKTLNN